MTLSRVVDGKICYPAKEVMNVYQLFNTRFTLFKSVYCHRVAKAIEYMITDILCEADVVWDGRLSKAADDPKDLRLLAA